MEGLRGEGSHKYNYILISKNKRNILYQKLGMVACAYNPLDFTNERKLSELSLFHSTHSTFICFLAQDIVLFFGME